MALLKVTAFDIATVPKEETGPFNMKLGGEKLNVDVAANIELPPIPLIKATSGKVEEYNIIKTKMR